MRVFPILHDLPLRPHQVNALAHVFRGPPYAYCAVDMGGGKSVIGIAVAFRLVAEGKKVLVVCPPSMRLSWLSEFATFAPWLKVGLMGRPNSTVSGIDVGIIGDMSLSNLGYKQERGVRPDPMDLLSPLARSLYGEIDCLIVDEVHRECNVTKRTRAVTVFARSCKTMRLIMSGTPVPNGLPSELASQIDIMGDGAWADIGGMGTFYGTYANDPLMAPQLYERMSNSWYYRVKLDEVVDLPPMTRTPLAIQATHVDEYHACEADLITYLLSQGKEITGAVKAQAMVKMMTLRALAGKCKVDGVVRRVLALGGAFVVAEHRDVIAALAKGLAPLNPVVFKGGMSDKAKQRAIQAFITGESKVMVGQITAAGVGLTLHGGGRNCNVVVAELPWHAAALVQAERRLWRMGQTMPVHVDVCLAAIGGSWTIDERLWDKLNVKAFASSMLTDGAGEWLVKSDARQETLDTYRDSC